MNLIDLHSDIITDIAFRREKGETSVFEKHHLPQLKQNGVIGLICVFWVEPLFRNNPVQRFRKLLRYALDDFEECSEVKIVTSIADLDKFGKDETIFIYLGLEGLSFIEEWEGTSIKEKISNAINELDRLHIRHSIFAWNESNFLGTGTGSNTNRRGLTDNGAFATEIMENKGWVIDVSHLDETTFWDVVNQTSCPLIASHSNAKQLCNHERNLSDEQIKEIARRNGIIGVNAHADFISDSNPTLERYVDHIVYIADLVGADHIGLGFDFTNYLKGYDLGTGEFRTTKNLESVKKVPQLIDEIARRGFSTSEMEWICSKNALDFLQNTLNNQIA